jgi:WD40 repeat protein
MFFPFPQFLPVTRVASEYLLSQHRQIAVSDRFITYGLKQGHVRVLDRFSEGRALLKAHGSPVMDMHFLPGTDGGTLATAGSDGRVVVWSLESNGGNAVHAKLLLQAKLQGADDVRLAQSPGCPGVVAAAGAGRVALLRAPWPAGEGETEVHWAKTPEGAVVLPFIVKGGATCLAWSADGKVLIAGGAGGEAYCCELDLPADGASLPVVESARSWGSEERFEGGFGSLAFLPGGDGRSLLAGNASNTTLSLGRLVSGKWELSQTVKITSKEGPGAHYCHVSLVPQQNLVLLADTPRKAMYSLHLAGRFHFLIHLVMPFLSFFLSFFFIEVVHYLFLSLDRMLSLYLTFLSF